MSRLYDTVDLGKVVKCGFAQDSPIVIQRATITSPLPVEVLHYHEKAHEFYIVVKGGLVVKVDDASLEVLADNMLHIFPGEVHKIAEVLGLTDYYAITSSSTPKDKVVVEEGL